MADKKGIPLSDVAGIPPEVRAKLAGLWITTAEELVSAAKREDGPVGLSEVLNMNIDQVADLVDLAQAALPPGVTFGPESIQTFGMGALDEPLDEDRSNISPLAFAPLPAKVDLRDRMPPVRDQGGRGTCVSFACTAVREYLLGTSSSSGNLSEQYLYWTCKEHDMLPGAGTFISTGMDRLLVEGECVEDVWPYNPHPMPGNESQDPPPAGAPAKAAPFKISETRKLPARSVADLKKALADGLPIAFAVPVYTYWFSDPARSTGDLRMPLNSDHVEGGHAMCMVGYEDDPNVPGGGYFMVRNSWGTLWANQSALSPGYARMPYGYMEQVGSAAHIALVTSNPPPPPPVENWFTRLLKFLRSLFGG